CRAEVTIKNFDRSLELTVRDNGSGFDPERAADGNGLANMKRRATRLGGTLEIRSSPIQGTSVRLLVPLDRNTRRSRH
ncbi:MAG TPA: ATP-binding protein, partial [Blastocatellia bacterium]|nr:ATP-binding protein [Blastocatellia bacterium]